MPKDKIVGNRLTVEYDPINPKEALEIHKKKLRGKSLNDLTRQEKDSIVKALIDAENRYSQSAKKQTDL